MTGGPSGTPAPARQEHGPGDDPVGRALDRLLVLFLVGAGFSIVVEQSAAILVCLIWLVDTSRRGRRPQLPLLWPSVAFLAAAFVSCAAALEPALAFGQLRSEWVPLVLYLVVANRPSGRRAVESRLVVMTWVAGLMVLTGLAQTIRHGATYRIDGTLGHWMTYSGVLVLLGCPLLASLLFREADGGESLAGARTGSGARRRPTRGEIARGVVLLGMAAALALTQTRGSWLGALAGLAVLVALRRARWLALVPLVAVAAFALAPPSARARVVDLADLADVTATERVYMWRAAADMLRDHPLTGVGLDNFRVAIDDYRLPDDPWIEGRPLSHAHSNPFMLAAERGLLGLLTWLVLWIAWLLLMVRTWRALPAGDRTARGAVAGSIAALVAFQVAGLTEYTWGDTEVVYLAGFLLGTGLAYTRQRT